MSVDDTLAAIDAAVGCQQCGRPLDGSVSVDFDTEECQTAWHTARASRLGGAAPVLMSMRMDSATMESRLASMGDRIAAFARDAGRALAAYDELCRAREALRAQHDRNEDSE